ncbi:predicted protein [Postia placenta Mad-698-R]|nr:predicted protein [Postia placenta Mad-698-R]
MADICLTFSDAASLLEDLGNSCRKWRLVLECIEDELLPTLSDVRMSINAQRPVNRLPDKILSEIFRQVPPSPLALYMDGLCISLRKFLVWESFFDFKDTGTLLPLTHYHLRSQSAPLRVLNIENEHLDVQQLWRTDGQHIQSLASYAGCDFDLPTSYAHRLQALAAWNCVLQGDVSNLKALVLRAVDWHLPTSLTNLTHLYLVRKRLRVVDLFRILSIAPRIEDLGLARISAEDAFDPHEDIPAITLQYLRRLTIDRPDTNILSGFFSHVGLPARLAVNLEHCEVSDLQWLVHLTQNDADLLCISAWTYSVVAAGPSRAVRFSCRHSLEGMVRWIATLPSHFQLKDLWIASTFNWDGFDETVIKRIPWVETLYLGSAAYDTFVRVLGDDPTCWPKLTKVVLSEPYELSMILKFAETRAHLGLPLEELECHKRRSTVSEEYLQDLEKIKLHVGVVRLLENDPIVLPLPGVCTDGVPSPYFWPDDWGYVLSRANYYFPVFSDA